MADVTERLPSRVEASAVKRVFYSTEVVRLDGGGVVTNQRWNASLAEWDISIPLLNRGSADYAAVVALFDAVKGSALTFDFHDVETCADVEVRIKDDTLVFQGVGNRATASLTLEEAR